MFGFFILLNLTSVPRREHGLPRSFDTISLSRAIVALHRNGVSCSCRHSGLVKGASMQDVHTESIKNYSNAMTNH